MIYCVVPRELAAELHELLREHFLAAVQERDQYWDLEVAFDDEARLLGVRGTLIHDQGAYTPQGINLPYNASTGLPGPC